MVLGLQNALWRSKRVLEQLIHFGRQKVSAWQGLRKGFCGPGKIGELLAPDVLLGSTWGTLGPSGARGWLAGC